MERMKRMKHLKRQNMRRLLLLISFILFPVTFYYLSPYLIIQGGFTGVITGSFIIFCAQFLFSLFFGRAFCGWVCPAGALQDYCMAAVDKKANRKAGIVKYFIWAPWLLTVILALLSAGGVKAVDFFYFTDHGISASGVSGYISYLFVMALIVAVALLVGRRGMCHTICWMAPFMVLGSKLKNQLGYPSLNLRAEPGKCVECGICTKNCPMSLEVAQMVKAGKMNNSECILCGECVDRCGKKAIHFTFKSR